MAWTILAESARSSEVLVRCLILSSLPKLMPTLAETARIHGVLEKSFFLWRGLLKLVTHSCPLE